MASGIRIPIWLTPDERSELERSSGICGLTVSEYIRQRCSGSIPRASVPPDFYLLCERLGWLYTESHDEAILTLLDDLRARLLEPDDENVRPPSRLKPQNRKNTRKSISHSQNGSARTYSSVHMNISVSPEEKERWSESARRMKVPLADHIRQCALRYRPEPVDPEPIAECCEDLEAYRKYPEPEAIPYILEWIRMQLIPDSKEA